MENSTPFVAHSILDARFTENNKNDFHALVTTTFGSGPQHSLESKYGNIYLRK